MKPNALLGTFSQQIPHAWFDVKPVKFPPVPAPKAEVLIRIWEVTAFTLKLWAKLEVPPWSPERNACVVYVCGSIEKFSGLGEKALQQGE